MAAPQQVEIPSSSGTLHAQLFKPDGAGPFPTVIALHGCGGLNGQSDQIQPRYRDWAEQLLKDGNAVLFRTATARESWAAVPGPRTRDTASRERVADIIASRRWLLQQSWVERPHIAARLVQWRQRAVVGGAPATGVAQWRAGLPHCGCALSGLPAQLRLAWSARVPTLILIGASDDGRRLECQQMMTAKGRSALARIIVYPGAYQDFDRDNLAVHAIAGVEAGSGGATSGPTMPAPDALKRVPEWFGQ